MAWSGAAGGSRRGAVRQGGGEARPGEAGQARQGKALQDTASRGSACPGGVEHRVVRLGSAGMVGLGRERLVGAGFGQVGQARHGNGGNG